MGINYLAPYAVGRPAPPGSVADFEVKPCQPREPGHQVRGEVVAVLDLGPKRWYTVYRTDHGYLLRFHDLVDIDLLPGQGIIQPYLMPQGHEDFVHILLVGTVSAFILALRGLAVLHASAFQTELGAVMILGSSGRGKTTVAALCCAAGAKFISDDLVCLQVGPEGGVVSLGTGSELRLRLQAFGIVDLFSPPLEGGRQTADGRLAVRPPLSPRDISPVAAVLIPRPSREARDVTLRAVPTSAALRHLLANARIPGLKVPASQRAHLETAAAVAAKVPMVEAVLPWGPPFDLAVPARLLALLAELLAADGGTQSANGGNCAGAAG